MDDVASRQQARYRRRRITRWTTFILVTLLTLGAFGVGVPFALRKLARNSHNDWQAFSNIGQTYGGVASIFGILALGGVVASLIYQSRDSADGREASQRRGRNELLALSMNDAALMECWGPIPDGDDDFDKNRQLIYCNMIVSYWLSAFKLGKLPDVQVREMSARMFAGAPGRRYWSVAGPIQRATYIDKREKIFIAILDEEYGSAVARYAELSSGPSSDGQAAAMGKPIVTLMFGLAGGTLISWVLSRRIRGNR